MPSVVVFDVNETLLDLSALDGYFEQFFGAADARREWFTQMLQSAFVSTIVGNYQPFGRIGQTALEMLSARRAVSISHGEAETILTNMRRLPPHSDVVEALTLLRDAGLRLAALTNSTQEVADEQMQHAGLRPYFEQVLSADSVQRLKPAPEPYHMAAERLGIAPDAMLLVAAHAWDIAGASHAGCRTAFLARPGQVADPLMPQPEIVAEDLREIARQIIEQTRSGAGSA